MASRAGIEFDATTTQSDLLYKLSREIQLDQNIRSLFHTLRVEGNKATHEFRTQHREAMDGLKVARALAIWYHQSFGKSAHAFKPGPFVLPDDPSQKLATLQQQMATLQEDLQQAQTAQAAQSQLTQLLEEQAAQERALAARAAEEREVYESLAEEALAFARSVADVRPLPLVRDLKCKHPQGDAYFQFARNMAKGMAKNLPAPVKGVITTYRQPFSASDHDAIDLAVPVIGKLQHGEVVHAYSNERTQKRRP